MSCCPLRQADALEIAYCHLYKRPLALQQSTHAHLHLRAKGPHGILLLNELIKILTHTHATFISGAKPHRSRAFSPSCQKSILFSTCWKSPETHNALNRMGYKGDGLKIRGNSPADDWSSNNHRELALFDAKWFLEGEAHRSAPYRDTVNTLPIYHHSSLCNAAEHKHAFVRWPLNNSAWAKCYDTFLIKVSLSRGGGIFQTLCSSPPRIKSSPSSTRSQTSSKDKAAK